MKALVQRLVPSIFVILAAALPASAQVTQFSAGAVEVRAFSARTSTEVYAAAYGGGLFRSIDTGANWTRIAVPAGGNDHYLTSVATDAGTTTRVVGGEEGLYTSTDGTTFTKRLHEPVSAVAMGASPFTTVLAGVKGLGVLRSTDSGVTFATTTGLTGSDITALAAHPSNANVFYAAAKPDGAGNRGGIFVSTNGGATWSLSANQPPIVNGQNQVWSLAVDTGGSVHAAVFRPADGGGDIYKQSGGAGAFNPSTDPAGSIAVHRDANTGTNVWAGTRYLGPRMGSGPAYNYMFSQNGSPNILYTSVNAFATFPGNASVALMAIKGAGVWRTTSVNGGSTAWTRVVFPNGDRVLSASHVGGSPSSMLLGMHAGGVWRSNTGGNLPGTFLLPTMTAGAADFAYPGGVTQISPFNSVWDISASPSNGSWIWAAVGNVGMHYGNDNPGIFRFNGTQWVGVSNVAQGPPANIVAEAGTITLPSAPVYGVELNTANDQLLYAGFLVGTGMMLRDNGTWSNLTVPSAPSATRTIVSSQLAPQRVIGLPFDDKPVVSNNFGANGSFAQVSVSQTGFERLRFFGVAENPTNLNNWIGATNKGIYVSNDAGATWTRVATTALLQQAVTAVGFKSTGRAFAGDRAGNRYCSPDGGANWVRLTTGVASFNSGVNAIRVVSGQLLYLTDGAGALREDGSC